jgi:hypothetical protein
MPAILILLAVALACTGGEQIIRIVSPMIAYRSGNFKSWYGRCVNA